MVNLLGEWLKLDGEKIMSYLILNELGKVDLGNYCMGAEICFLYLRLFNVYKDS